MSDLGVGGGVGAEGDEVQLTPRQRLRRKSRHFARVVERIQELKKLVEQFSYDKGSNQYIEAKDELDRLRGVKNELSDDIDRIVENHPNLADELTQFGYDPKAAGDGGSGGDGGGGGNGSGTSGGSGDGGGDGSGGGGTSGGDGDGKKLGNAGPSGHSGWKLPGIKGKDFQVVRYKGKIFVTYKIPIGGNNFIRDAWRVPDDNLGAYGIKRSDARDLTRAQAKRLHFFGSAKDIRVHGQERHPFRQFLEKAAAQYGGTGIYKNKEVMSILLMGFVEQWDSESIKGKIRQTSWWQNSTAYSRRWATELTAKDKELTIEANRAKIKDSLRSLFGDNYMRYVKDGKIGDWAEKIASGRYGLEGNPDDAFAQWQLRQRNKAEKILGTPAQVAHDENRQQMANSLADPANMRARIRDLAVQELGYDGRPDDSVLDRWARRLASGQVTDQDYKNFLRRQKAALHPYLAPS